MGSGVGLLLVGVLVASDVTEDAAKKELEKLQGDWTVVSQTSGGRAQGQEWLDKAKLNVGFKADRFVFTSFGKTEEYAIKVDPSTDPKTLLIKLVAVNGKAIEDREIEVRLYELKGDTLKLALGYDQSMPIKKIDPNSKDQVVYVATRMRK